MAKPRTIRMKILLFSTSLAALSLTGATYAAGEPAQGAAQRVDADINCAALYSNMARLDPPQEEAWDARGIAVVDAYVDANPPAPADEDRYSEALTGLLVDRIEALAAPILALNADTAMDRGDRMAAMVAEFTAIWSGVRACDARYSFEPLPSPFNWID
jgi:hypothetical protein